METMSSAAAIGGHQRQEDLSIFLVSLAASLSAGAQLQTLG